jgi:hypothetical protein
VVATPAFVKVVDAGTLLIPDAPGNNRLDTLENIIQTGSIGLLFLVPGVDETLRVNGRAVLSTDAGERERCADARRVPALVIRVTVQASYLHCAKALMRSALWDASRHVERSITAQHGRDVARPDRRAHEPGHGVREPGADAGALPADAVMNPPHPAFTRRTALLAAAGALAPVLDARAAKAVKPAQTCGSHPRRLADRLAGARRHCAPGPGAGADAPAGVCRRGAVAGAGRRPRMDRHRRDPAVGHAGPGADRGARSRWGTRAGL